MIDRFEGKFNMSADGRLLAEAEHGRIGYRVYGWVGPWISLGSFQNPGRDLLDPNLVPWVMRPTGGKAVLHGHDVTVGLAIPLSSLSEHSGIPEERLSRSLRSVYRLAIQPIIQALRSCGLPAGFAEERSPAGKVQMGSGRTSDCFAFTSPNDVVHETLGIKVCGCALKLTQKAVLVQASIPAGPPLIDPARVFAKPSQVPFVPWECERFEREFENVMSSAEPLECAMKLRF